MRFLGLGDLIKIFIKIFFTNLETYDYVFFFKNLGEELEANVSLGFVQTGPESPSSFTKWN